MTVKSDVVDGRPAGVVMPEEIFDIAVAQPGRVEVLEARPTSSSLSAQ